MKLGYTALWIDASLFASKQLKIPAGGKLCHKTSKIIYKEKEATKEGNNLAFCLPWPFWKFFLFLFLHLLLSNLQNKDMQKSQYTKFSKHKSFPIIQDQQNQYSNPKTAKISL